MAWTICDELVPNVTSSLAFRHYLRHKIRSRLMRRSLAIAGQGADAQKQTRFPDLGICHKNGQQCGIYDMGKHEVLQAPIDLRGVSGSMVRRIDEVQYFTLTTLLDSGED